MSAKSSYYSFVSKYSSSLEFSICGSVYWDFPHLLQNFACAGIEEPQTIQFLVALRGLGSSMSTGLNVGSCGEGRLNPPPAGPAMPPAPTKPPTPNPACGDGLELPPVGLLTVVPLSMAVFISIITRTARKFNADDATRNSPIFAKNSFSPILPCLYNWFASMNDSYRFCVSLTSCFSFSANPPRLSTPKDIKKLRAS